MLKEEPIKNIFLEKDWTMSDYTNYNAELLQIGEEYRTCQELANNDTRWKVDSKYKRRFATEYFQIRNGGMSESLEVKLNFNINNGKINRYLKWSEFGKTSHEKEEDRKVHLERFNVIGEMIKKLSTNI